MRLLKKCLKYIGVFILLCLACATIYIYNSGPELPEETNDTINEVQGSPLPELVKGHTGFARSQGLDIWYESIQPADSIKGVVLLIMGISNDALGWPPDFLNAFLDAGYQVVRYDHRETGLSSWECEGGYSLKDMARDGLAILDTLGIEKAHILGASMGGMIAQEMVIHYPDRAASLVSMMSSGNIFDQQLAPISSEVAWDLIKVAIKYGAIGSEKNMIKLHLASRMILMGEASYSLNIRNLSEQVLYNIRNRKGYNPAASKKHQAAVAQSGSRYAQLKLLDTPALIIHGQADPFIPIGHGQKCCKLIPAADSLWIKNMGHDIPDLYLTVITDKIIDFFEQGRD